MHRLGRSTKLLKTPLHFLGRRPGKGNDQNVLRIDMSILNEILDALGDDRGFAGARPRQHHRRPRVMHDGLLLMFRKAHRRPPAVMKCVFRTERPM